MAKTNVKIYNDTLSDSNATLYTVPANKQTIVKSICLCNRSAAEVKVKLKLDGIYLLYDFPIPAYDTYPVSAVDQIIDTGDLIEGNANAASAIDCLISGYEVDV